MTIESAIQSHFTTEFAADPNLAGLSVEVYPHTAPQTASYPFVNYSILESDVEATINGAQADLTLTGIMLELEIWTETVAARALIMTSVKDIMHGKRGAIGTEALNIRSCFIDSVNSFSERDITGSDEEVFRASMVLSIFYNWS